MNAIRLKMRVESDTLVVPALNNLVGKQVEIIIIEESSTELPPFEKLRRAAGKDLVDHDAFKRLREASRI